MPNSYGCPTRPLTPSRSALEAALELERELELERHAREGARGPRWCGRGGARRGCASARRAPSSTQATSMKAWNRMVGGSAGGRDAGGGGTRARGPSRRGGTTASGARRAARRARRAVELARRLSCCWRRGWRRWRRRRAPRGREEEVDAAAVEQQRHEVREDAETLRRGDVEFEDGSDSRSAKESRQQPITTPAGVAFCIRHDA